MKVASDFRANARNALKGKWGVAVLAGITASLAGAIDSQGIEINFKSGSEGGVFINLGPFLQDIDISRIITLSGILTTLITVALVYAVATFIIGSVVGVGYARFNLDLVDGKEEAFPIMFGYFGIMEKSIALKFLRSLYIALWSLLFIIPGIIAELDYSMAVYIMAENTEITAGEALRRSKEMMCGNRWRLFCLRMSFIGWILLTVFTFGIGDLWLIPYTQVSVADFYREISGTRRDECEIE